MGDDLWDIPDQLVQVAFLFGLTIHFQADLTIRQVPNLFDRDDIGHRRTVLERFANLPRSTCLFCLTLKVASGHVQTQGITVNMVQGLAGRNVGAALTDCHHHFYFEMNVA